AKGTTIVMVSHKPSVLSQADKLMMIRAGRIEKYGPREDVLRALNPPQAPQGKPPSPALAEVKP
ncbi:MAG: hypothetical protein KAY22_25870, partial [Rhizorhabdus sp.]